MTPGSSEQVVKRLLGEGTRTERAGEVALTLGLLSGLLVLTMTMGQIERGANRIYGVERDRPALAKYVRAAVLAFTTGVPALLGFLILVGGGAMGDSVDRHYHWGTVANVAWDVVRWPLSLGLTVLAVALLFRHAPRRSQPSVSWVLFGGTIATVLWWLTGLRLAAYVTVSGEFGQTYGAGTGLRRATRSDADRSAGAAAAGPVGAGGRARDVCDTGDSARLLVAASRPGCTGSRNRVAPPSPQELEVPVATVKDVVRRPLGHFAERSLAGLVTITGAGAAFGLLIMLVRVKWDPLFAVDHGVAARLNDLVSPHGPLVTVLNAITDLGGRPVILWLVTVAAVGLFIRRQGRLAVYVIVTGIGAVILDLTLKTLVDRLRPEVEVPIGSYAGASFPSGHALGSMVAYGALLLVFLPAMAPRWRKPAIALVTVLVVAIGLTRIALGVHFVSDVVGAWLLGITWLGVTSYAFRLWRRERGLPAPPLTEGLEPEASRDITPAPDEVQVVPHPRSAVAELLVGWVLVFGAVYGFGMYVSYYADGTFLAPVDREVPRWFAERHTDELTGLSMVWSKLGDTHAILFVSMVFCPLIVAVWRRWRPVLFVALAMFGELSLFLASSAAVDRPRPEVDNLDGRMPTSSFPSGHMAATICLYLAIAILVMARTDRGWRWLTVTLAVIMPVGVATSRMYRGMHHPTDLMGAILLSALWMGLLYWVLRPNADVDEGNQPSIESEEVGTLEDELTKAARPD